VAAQCAGALRYDQAKLCEQAADLIDKGRALAFDLLADTMHHEQGLLFCRLDGYEAHIRPGDGFIDVHGIIAVGFIAFAVGGNELG